MPDVFGLKEITFWQALRILILAGILFSGGRVIERSTGMAPGVGAGTTSQHYQQPGKN